jgi:predicted phosphodiesterase
MTKLNLGTLVSPIVIFGGPYSNLQALESIKLEAERLGIPPSHCICTGDIVAYCGQPNACVDFIRNWGIHCVMGNCEESFATNAEDCGCGFEEGTSCDLLSGQWFEFANSRLDNTHREWFAQLPRQLAFEIQGKKVVVIHGSLSSINQFVFASTADLIFTEQFALTDADLVIGGHCGIPFTKLVDNKIWHNTGAIGMPANDGTTQTWFSLLNTENGLSLESRSLHYDHESAYHDMQQAGMNNGYAAALKTGLWPSMDVLPEQEKTNRGVAIKECCYPFAMLS